MGKVQMTKGNRPTPLFFAYLPADIMQQAGFTKGTIFTARCNKKGTITLDTHLIDAEETITP